LYGVYMLITNIIHAPFVNLLIVIHGTFILLYATAVLFPMRFLYSNCTPTSVREQFHQGHYLIDVLSSILYSGSLVRNGLVFVGGVTTDTKTILWNRMYDMPLLTIRTTLQDKYALIVGHMYNQGAIHFQSWCMEHQNAYGPLFINRPITHTKPYAC